MAFFKTAAITIDTVVVIIYYGLAILARSISLKKLKLRYLTIPLSLTIVTLLMLLAVGCGGGGGKSSIFRGDWLGAWSDSGQNDTGLFAVTVNKRGDFNGTARNSLCGSSGSATGAFKGNSTKLNMRFNENNVCWSYSVQARGGPMTLFQDGYGAPVAADHYDRFGEYIGTVDWGLYMERNGRSPDDVRGHAKELSAKLDREEAIDDIMASLIKGNEPSSITP